jgi:hypothetical protein
VIGFEPTASFGDAGVGSRRVLLPQASVVVLHRTGSGTRDEKERDDGWAGCWPKLREATEKLQRPVVARLWIAEIGRQSTLVGCRATRDSGRLAKADGIQQTACLCCFRRFSILLRFPEVHAILSALRAAFVAARPSKIVCLSTIGAQATLSNLLRQLGIIEEKLGDLPMPIAFVRAGWFHGERRVGRSVCARWSRAKLSATARPARANGRDRRHRTCCRNGTAAVLDRTPRSSSSKDHVAWLRDLGAAFQNSGPLGTHGSNPAVRLGIRFQIAGHDQSVAAESR